VYDMVSMWCMCVCGVMVCDVSFLCCRLSRMLTKKLWSTADKDENHHKRKGEANNQPFK